MATRIPQYQRRVAPEVAAAPRVSQASVDASGLARGLSSLANDLNQIHQREVQEANETYAISVNSGATEWKNNRLYNPENGAMSQKGESAIGLTDRVMSDWNAYSQSVIEKARTPSQKKIATHNMSIMGSQIQGQLSPYELQEIKVYKDGVSAGGVVTAQNDAALNFNTPGAIDQARMKIEGILGLQGERNGWSPELLSANRQTAVSRMHSGVVSQIASTDPLKAQQYMLANAESISPSDHLKLANAIRPLVDRQIGIQVGKQAVSQASQAASDLFSSMIKAESSGQQFDANGAPLTSSKGAVGIAQVMPDTGPEAAKAAGLPWDEERFRTDANYNHALGEAYFGKLLQSFGGSKALAVAAYNAGPGKVQEWLTQIGDPRTGEISESEFVENIPFKETKDYIQKVLNAAQTETQPTFGSIAQEIDARDDLTAEQKRIAIADARDRFTWQQEQVKQVHEQNQTRAWDFLLAGSKWQDLDPSLWASLSAKDRKQLMTFKPNQPTDPEVYTRARDLIVSGHEVNLLDMRDKFSNEDFTRLTDLQIKRLASGPSATASIATSTAMFNDALRNAGMKSNPKPGSNDAKRLAEARRYVDDQIRGLEEEQGKKATRDQVQQIIDHAFIQGQVQGSGVFGLFTNKRRTFERQPGENVLITDIKQIPLGELDEIKAALGRAKQEVTDKAILNLFNEANQ